MSQGQEMSDDEVARIEEERSERLDQDARPDGAEVDNTDREFDATKGMFTDSPGYDEAPAAFPAPQPQEEPAEDQVEPDDQPSVEP